MAQAAKAARKATTKALGAAVHRARPLSREGALERLFTYAFSKLVYAQIWEDPVIDMQAMDLRPEHRIIAIASGGCNVMSYMTANPEAIVAVDLNSAHVALGKLKICAARNLPDYESFFQFFGRADDRANVALYDRHLRARLDATTRAYWDGRNALGRRRVNMFSRNLYRFGLLGRFMTVGHALARLHGIDPSILLQARSRSEQRRLFETRVAPIFDKPLVRWMTRRPASLYGLGIPPAQYEALSAGSRDGVAEVLRQRLERLACDFDLADNYFGWQAFGRSYAPGPNPSLPPYLQRENFEALKTRADRIEYAQISVTERLAAAPAASFDRYVLLDAQDWMSDAELTALWEQISRTARPGARVIFRTAAEERLLPGRIPDALLDQWRYEEDASRDFTARDRSSIYGAFHLYTRKG